MPRLLDLLAATHSSTPLLDRYLALAAMAVAASAEWLEQLDGWLGRCVVVATLAMVIPRAILGWRDVHRAQMERRAKRDEARRLLEEVERECEGCGPSNRSEKQDNLEK